MTVLMLHPRDLTHTAGDVEEEDNDEVVDDDGGEDDGGGDGDLPIYSQGVDHDNFSNDSDFWNDDTCFCRTHHL